MNCTISGEKAQRVFLPESSRRCRHCNCQLIVTIGYNAPN
jgi:hypothetical protein